MKTLALDLSSKSSGWSIFEDGKYIKSGCITASSTDLIKRINKITTELMVIIGENEGIQHVIMEEVIPSQGHNSNTNVLKALLWLQGQVCIMLHEKYPNITKEFIMPNSWRSKISIATGRGVKRETLKEANMRHVKEVYGLTVSDDEADAIGINEAYYSKASNELNFTN